MFSFYKTTGEIKCILPQSNCAAFKNFLQFCTLWRLSTQLSFVLLHPLQLYWNSISVSALYIHYPLLFNSSILNTSVGQIKCSHIISQEPMIHTGNLDTFLLLCILQLVLPQFMSKLLITKNILNQKYIPLEKEKKKKKKYCKTRKESMSKAAYLKVCFSNEAILTYSSVSVAHLLFNSSNLLLQLNHN